jgi:ketosteroid isomerase-like protein
MQVDRSSADLELVRRYRRAFSTFDPTEYHPFLAADPVYHAGLTTRSGLAAYDVNTGAGRVLYPFGALRTTERRAIAEGGWVAMLVDREAITNRGAHYENVYAMFYEVVDGRIATQVELMDFRVSSDKFDLSALGPELRLPGEQRPPAQVAEPPAADDPSPSAVAKRTVLEFLDAFLSFKEGTFEHLLADDPLHQVGMTRRTGVDAFRRIAGFGRVLYPHGIAGRTVHALVSDGRTVAALVSLRAVTNTGADYENLYGMFFDVHDGRIVSMIENLDNRVAATAFDTSALG